MRNMLTWPSPSNGMLRGCHRVLRVGTDAVERAVQVGRDLAGHLAIVDVGFEPIEPRLLLLQRRQRRVGRPRAAHRQRGRPTGRRLRLLRIARRARPSAAAAPTAPAMKRRRSSSLCLSVIEILQE